MREGLFSDLSIIGYEIFLEGETIRLRYKKSDSPPESAKLLIDELRKYKAEAVNILKTGNTIAPPKKIQPGENACPVWPTEAQMLIDWFKELEPPAAPFYQEPHILVIDPEKYFAALRREIQTGPTGPRARMGTLQADLRVLRAKFN